MSKKSDKDLENLVGGIFGLVALGFFGLWFTDRTKFYIYIAVIILVIAIAVYVLIKIKKHRFDKVNHWFSGKSLLGQLRAMRPVEFEDYIADLYNRLGYTAQAVGRSHDGGIDVVASKDGIKHYIQCKKYITSKVGVSEVRDFYGAMAGQMTGGKGIFITTNIFTSEAEQFADDKPLELIDGDKLLRLIKSVKKDKEVIASSAIASCPKCGGKLVERCGKFGNFMGCENYPKCKFTKNI